MRKLLLSLLLAVLFAPAVANGATTAVGLYFLLDCDDISPSAVALWTDCRQGSTVGGRTAGHYYRRNAANNGWDDITGGGDVSLGPNLEAIDGLTSAANKLPYFTGSGTAAVADFTAFGRLLVDDADAAAARTTLGLAIGTNVQAYDAQLTDVAGLTPTDNAVIIGNGTNFVVESGATLKTSLGLTIGTDVQAQDAELSALAGLTSAANKCPNFSGSGTAALYDCTSYGRGLLNIADEAAFKALVNLEAGTDVQAFDSDLSALASNSTNGLWAHTGAGTGSARTITAGTGISVANGDGVSGNPTVTVLNPHVHASGSGAPSAGTGAEAKFFVDITNHKTYVADCDGCNYRLVAAEQDGYTTVNGDSGSVSPAGADTLKIAGTANEITTVAASSSPDTVTASIASTFRITGKTATAPVKTGTSDPGTCTVGDLLFRTDLTAGSNMKGCTATNTWTALGSAGSGAKSTPMRLSTVETGNANAFVDTISGSNVDFSGVRFVDAVTGDAYYTLRVPVGFTQDWGLAASWSAVSGSGGNIVTTISACIVADNAAKDCSLTALETTATHTIRTSANQTITALGTDYDATLALTAGNFLKVKVSRIGGNGSDTISADVVLEELTFTYVGS